MIPFSDYTLAHFKHFSKKVTVGNIILGGYHPICIQSMTNTNTMDTDATVRQVIELAEAGCEMVRITAPGIKEAENLGVIKNILAIKGYTLPLIADIHFNPKAAEVAAQIVEKVRINPGNYVDQAKGKVDWSSKETELARERIAVRLVPLLKICKTYDTAIRIGINHGSLSERMLSTYGNTPSGMIESAMEFIHICHDFGFHKLILSMKASDVRIMIEANELLVKRMIEEGFHYPLHLGVTEAGAWEEARIKSAAGIGSLLARGIGDTIRVSLTEDPVNEIPFAQKLSEFYGRNKKALKESFSDLQLIDLKAEKSLKDITGNKNPVVTSGYSEFSDLYLDDELLKVKQSQKLYPYKKNEDDHVLNDQSVIYKKAYENIHYEELLIKASVDFSLIFLNQTEGGIWIECGSDHDKTAGLSLMILQALGLRYSKAELIACPSCGRTQFDIMNVFEKVKQQTSHLKGLKIAVMGCIVNGPGEMAGADYGYVGAGTGKVTLYETGEPVIKNISEEGAVENLIKLIKENDDWSQSK